MVPSCAFTGGSARNMFQFMCAFINNTLPKWLLYPFNLSYLLITQILYSKYLPLCLVLDANKVVKKINGTSKKHNSVCSFYLNIAYHKVRTFTNKLKPHIA